MTGPTLTILGQRLEYRWIDGLDPAAPPLVFLHEGLGSVSLWRDFPDHVAAATGCPALVYSRRGYGASEPLTPPYRRPPDYMHGEALEVLPQVLDHFGIHRPILFGHSDGATVALIHAGSAGRPVAAVIVEAPHVTVEPEALTSIRAAREAWETTDLPHKLARHHHHPEGTFLGWAETWLHPDFHDMDIRDLLPGISCPLLVIQGEDDEYGTLAQVEAVTSQVSGPTESLVIPRCRHSPHRDRPEVVLNATLTFLDRHLPQAGG
jgi:pimeloyl-ACP methyl ester carboxylesterase